MTKTEQPELIDGAAPYYHDAEAGIAIYCADCRELLPLIRRTSLDAVVTDPPFFMPAMHYQSRIRHPRSWGDTTALAEFWAGILDKGIPALKRTGHWLTFCNGDSYPVMYPEAYRRFDALACLVWNKGHVGLGRVWRHQHELVIAARWETSTFLEDGQLRADVFTGPATPSAERSHPVEKPLGVMLWLMKPVARPLGLILDPFLGGGSTLLAAQHLGCRAIGIDTEKPYCEIAANRLRQGVFDFGGQPR